MKKYFIDITCFQALNKLDEQLQRAFLDEFSNRLIQADQLDQLKDLYDLTVAFYKSSGGKATMAFTQPTITECGDMYASIVKGNRTSVRILLIATRGDVLRV